VNVESAIDDMIALLEALEHDGDTLNLTLSTMTATEQREALAALLIATHVMFGSARTEESLADLWRRRRDDLAATITTITNGGNHGSD